MNHTEQLHVTDKNGVKGTIDPAAGPPFDGTGAQVLVRLEDGRAIAVPTEALVPRKEGGYFLPLSLFDLETPRPNGTATPPDQRSRPGRDLVVMPIIEEELNVGKREVETGRVRIRKVVREREEVVDEPLLQEDADIKRVAVNRIVDGPVPVRYEGDMMIVPLLEEVIVTEKRLLLKEELHISVRQSETRNPQLVTLRSEEAIIERLDGQAEWRNDEAQPE
ncbi:MAG TPA: YsnF/AvaK domain-containing protein [Pyrinomonadaceae bacterium]|nr:YsnF/AvaK domain-containing protein [Pyrinomonadaceae bacterium]